MALNQPSLIPEPWASQGSRTTIPDTTSESGRASWAQGFPPETALPLGSGGVPPHWLDFQGVLHALSNHAVFKQSGGRYAWSASLDYPVGACIIGSNNRVYQALQNSGPGYSAGAKNPTTAGNSAYWGVLATPDGSSIVVNGNGKLAVSATNLADQLADGTTIVASGGKLTAVNQGEASALADGQTIVAANGKLKVNYGAGLDYDSQTGKLIVVFNDLTVEQIAALCDPDGGIAAGANGLYVDFDTMPTDKFEALLKSLKMQIPLSANMTVYVATNDAAASDAIEDGRGTEAKPFKTVQACINWVTQNYALGAYVVYIKIKPGTYSEALVLPSMTHTTGGIVLDAYDATTPPVFVNPTENSVILSVTGGSWYIRRLSLIGTRSATNDGLSHFPETITVSGGETSLSIYGCSLSETYSGNAPLSGYTYIRMINSRNGATCTFHPFSSYATSLEFHKGNSNSLTVFNLERGGKVNMPSTNSDSDIVEYPVRGEMTTFAAVTGQSLFTDIGGGLYAPSFVVPSGASVTGKKYLVTTGGGIDAPSGGFPGDTEGTVASSTGGWYTT